LKAILLYFDGLPASQRALELAETLTSVYAARLVLLYVRSRHLLPGPSTESTSAPTLSEAGGPILSVPDQVREEEMRQSLGIIEKGREQLEAKGIKADYLIVEGNTVDAIVREASKSYDLLICPIASKSEESALNAGALQKLATRLSCSILVVR
jgi:nucleotide-binding universal stress UspA family protein